MAPRDSLELASLASSIHRSHRESIESSDSRAPSSRRLSFEEDPLNPNSEANGARDRSYSVSSAFDFASNFYPLSSTAAGYEALGGGTSSADPTSTLNGASLE